MKDNIRYTIALSVLLTFSLVSCLKDKNFDNRLVEAVATSGTQKIIEVSITTSSTANFLQIAMNDSNKDTTLSLMPITLASASPASEDINVTLVVNPSILGDYNSMLHQKSDNSSYETPVPSLYTVINPASSDGTGYVVTIPKGSYTGYLQVKFLPHNFLGHNYAFPFMITSIDKQGYLISSNLSTGIVAIGLKNQWDGVYSMKGSALRAGDPVLTGNFSGKEMSLITSGASSVIFGSNALWGDGGTGISVGYPILSINNTGSSPYAVTITSSGGAINNPTYASVYNAATKTFFISFTWGAGPASRLGTDTLVYNRPR